MTCVGTELSEELDHVMRPALPWRTERRTECGLPEKEGRSIITRDAFKAKLARQGQTRSAMTTCMTCWATASRWKGWAESPTDVLRRELPAWSLARGRPAGNLLDAELLAIAALIEAHRGEFDDFLTDLAATTDLDAVRAAARRRALTRGRSRLL